MITATKPAVATDCVVCHRLLPQGDLSKVALMFRPDGRIAGWGCGAHAIDLPRVIRQTSMEAMCARCGLPLVGDHGVTQGSAWCRDGSDFELATSTVPPMDSTRNIPRVLAMFVRRATADVLEVATTKPEHTERFATAVASLQQVAIELEKLSEPDVAESDIVTSAPVPSAA